MSVLFFYPSLPYPRSTATHHRLAPNWRHQSDLPGNRWSDLLGSLPVKKRCEFHQVDYSSRASKCSPLVPRWFALRPTPYASIPPYLSFLDPLSRQMGALRQALLLLPDLLGQGSGKAFGTPCLLQSLPKTLRMFHASVGCRCFPQHVALIIAEILTGKYWKESTPS